MGRTRIVLIGAALTFGLGLAGSPSVVAGSITFNVPRTVTIRQNGATPVRGMIRSMSPEEIVVRLNSGGERTFVTSEVTSVVSADNTFKYMPAQESFDDFLVRSASLKGVSISQDPANGASPGSAAPSKSIGGVSDAYARSIGMQPPPSPKSASASGGFAQSGGYAGAGQRPRGPAQLTAPTIPELDQKTVVAMEQERRAAEIEASTPKFALPGGATMPASPITTPSGNNMTFALPAVTEEVFICSNPACGKEVRGAKYGDKCPHCGIIWAPQSNAEVAAAAGNGQPLVDPRNPFAKPAQPGAAPQTGQPVALPNQVPAPVAVAPSGGFDLQSLPWWGKALGFGGLILLLMFISQRR
jgi:hypothetical protein